MPAHIARPGGACSRWRPAALVTTDIIALKLTLGFVALVPAGDYAHGARDRYPMLEAAFPMWLWSGWAFSVGACILTGIAWQRHVVVWLGHTLGAGLYAILSVAQAAAAFERWPPTAPVTSSIPNPVWALCLGGLAVGAVVAVRRVRSAPRRCPAVRGGGAWISW